MKRITIVCLFLEFFLFAQASHADLLNLCQRRTDQPKSPTFASEFSWAVHDPIGYRFYSNIGTAIGSSGGSGYFPNIGYANAQPLLRAITYMSSYTDYEFYVYSANATLWDVCMPGYPNPEVYFWHPEGWKPCSISDFLPV